MLKLLPGRWPHLIPFMLFLAFLTLYWHTLAGGVLPADNGELQLVAAKLGVAHPPGFPLYTLLGHLMSELPLSVDPAYKINLLSAITSALTLVLLYQIVYRLSHSIPAGIIAALALGSSTTFWAQATTANIRSLTALFATLCLWLLLRSNQLPWTWFAFALALGLTHHASLFFMGGIFGLYALKLDPNFLKSPGRWLRPGLAALLGLSPLLYLPLRAQANAPGANPSLATWAGFWDHVLARGFQGDFFYFATPAGLWERLKMMANVMTFQFQPLLLGGMVLGLLLLLWRGNGRLAFLLAGSFAIHLLVTATYRAPQTVEYMLPAYVPAGICLGYCLTWGQEWPRQWAKVGQFGLTSLLLLTAGWQGLKNYPSYAFLSQDHTARIYAETLLEAAPAGAAILADWHWATPLWYLQEVEQARPDVAIHFVFPTAESYEQTWVRRISEEYATGRDVIATHFNAEAYTALLAPEPLGAAFLFAHQPRLTLPAGYTPLNLSFGQRIQLLGYQLEPPMVEIGQETVLTLAWQATRPGLPATTLFAHLVGSNGQLYAQEDVAFRPAPAGISLTQFRLTPRPGALPGEFSVVVGAYSAADGLALPDQDGQPRSNIANLKVTTMSRPLFSQQVTFRPGTGRTLVGYDWDNTLPGQIRLYLHWQSGPGYVSEVIDLPAGTTAWTIADLKGPLTFNHPQFYVPLGQGIVWLGSSPIPAALTAGQSLTLVQHFGASRPVLSDLVVSGRLIGYEPDNVHWAWWDLEDGIPALGGIPSLKWIGGSQVRDPHFFTIDSQATSEQAIGGLVRLYDAFTGRSLPILDERISQHYLGIPLFEN